MATFDSGRQRYSMNFYASHQRPLQRRSYTGRPSRPAEGQLRVNLDKTPSEHNESAMPPKLAVKADVGDRQRWATRRHCCLFALVSPPAGARQIGVPRPLVTSLNHLPAVRHTQDDWSFQASSQNSTAVADTSVLVAASPRCELTTRLLPPNKNLQRSILSLAEAVATVSNEEGSS